MAIEEEIEDNYDEETRDEVRNTMKPILETRKITRRKWRNLFQLWILKFVLILPKKIINNYKH